MGKRKVYRALGLMSGTSLDGIDAALLETDGEAYIKPLEFRTAPYPEDVRAALRTCLGLTDLSDPKVVQAAQAMTRAHLDLVREFDLRGVDVIGFHGQTIHHDAENRLTVQIGDAALLAKETGIDVVHDFRSADVKAGGQGAPFLPLYHRARVKADGLVLPLAVLNIGGVANVTWIDEDDILAFDTGPGNALIDDFMQAQTGARFDAHGETARKGRAYGALVEGWMAHPYFRAAPPKSLDRNAWDVNAVQGLSAADGAATLLAFTVEAIAQGAKLFPAPAPEFLVSGGGRHNVLMMERLHEALCAPVRAVEEVGWNGDALEAEGFAYLAVRSLLGEALSLPGTTGVPRPQTGGVLRRAG